MLPWLLVDVLFLVSVCTEVDHLVKVRPRLLELVAVKDVGMLDELHDLHFSSE